LGNGGAAINLSSSDAGETFSYYPSDGYNTAIFDGGATTVNWAGGPSPNGLSAFFCISSGGTSPITFNGLQFQRMALTAVYSASPVVFTNNVVHDGTRGSESGGDGDAIEVHNASLTATQNYIYNMQGDGIEAIADTGYISNSVISNNYIQNVCQNLGDCGCVYLGNPNPTTVSTNITVSNNYCRDVYPAGNGNPGSGNQGVPLTAGICVYLDNGASNVTIEGNVCTGLMGWFVHVHGGSNNIIKYNILDQGADAAPALAYYQALPGYAGSGMTGNVWTNNIIIQHNQWNKGQLAAPYNGSSSPAAPMTVNNNFYYNFIASIHYNTCNSAGNVCAPNPNQDATPTPGADPQITCYGANIAAGSPVFDSPTNFPAQPADWDRPGYWGPPNFIIPSSGTAPSWSINGCTD
jgi:hypothetical protein